MTFDPNAPELDAGEVRDRVDEAIEENELVLFMKGDELMPQCGYSDRAIGLVKRYRDDVEVVDTLQNLEGFREALEAHSGWETIPQTFVDGEFVGGSDVLAELEERGELAETLNADSGAVGDATSGESVSGESVSGESVSSGDNADAPF